MFLLFDLLVIVVLVLISRSTTQREHILPAFSLIKRLDYWQGTLQIIKSSPLIGVGLGNFDLVQSRYAHNSYLQIWAEMGILGIISILWLIIAVFKSAFMNIKKGTQNNQIVGFISANTVFLAHNFVDFTFFLPEVAMIWWIIVGLIISKYNNELDHRNTNL
jgi:putative inorganic carbon (HCO3(-)) transporter